MKIYMIFLMFLGISFWLHTSDHRLADSLQVGLTQALSNVEKEQVRSRLVHAICLEYALHRLSLDFKCGVPQVEEEFEFLFGGFGQDQARAQRRIHDFCQKWNIETVDIAAEVTSEQSTHSTLENCKIDLLEYTTDEARKHLWRSEWNERVALFTVYSSDPVINSAAARRQYVHERSNYDPFIHVSLRNFFDGRAKHPENVADWINDIKDREHHWYMAHHAKGPFPK